ncbi:MAG TPA: hypothetical protein VM100_02955 [Longimicrobiales bacterium]|nr:hypothetical protein [Longimicrobiales bacterium]
MVEAQISLGDGQSLMQYFASRKQYVNMRGAKWASTDEFIKHAVLKVEQVLWAAALDNDIPLNAANIAATPRDVEIQLEGGLLVRAGISAGDGQRLSDYLESQPQFLPMRNAQLLRSGRPPKEVNVSLGDIVLNQAAVQAMWEVAAQKHEEEAEAT